MKNNICIIFVIFFATLSQGFAQVPEWLDGKWIVGNVIYEISGTTISKVWDDGAVVHLGDFYVDDKSVIIVNGEPCGLKILEEERALVSSSNPMCLFTKWEDYSLPSEYQWILGKWTPDGNMVLSLSKDSISVEEGGTIINSGIYILDGEQIFVFWNRNGDFMDSFILLPSIETIAIEGGDKMIKIPKEYDSQAGYAIIDLFTLSSRVYTDKLKWIKLKWIYGEWQEPNTNSRIYITPKYYQCFDEDDNSLQEKKQSNIEKIKYTITEEENQILGTVVRIGDYYLDIPAQSLYSVSGLNQRIYLEKVSNYPLIYVILALIGLVAVALLILITIMVKRITVAVKRKIITRKEKKRKIKAEKAKKAKEKLVLPTYDNDATVKPVRVSQVLWIFFICVDFVWGLVALLLRSVYKLMVKRNIHNGLISKVDNVLVKLKHNPFIILLLIGVLVWREISFLIGILIVLTSVICSQIKRRKGKRYNLVTNVEKHLSLLINDIEFRPICRVVVIFILCAILLLKIIVPKVLIAFACVLFLIFIIGLIKPSIIKVIGQKATSVYVAMTDSAFYKKLYKVSVRKWFKVAFIVVIAVMLMASTRQTALVGMTANVILSFGSSDDTVSEQSFGEKVSQKTIYSWVYGKWMLVMHDDVVHMIVEEAHMVELKSNGTYTSVWQGGGDTLIEYGYFEIVDGKIRLTSYADNTSSYIYIEGLKLSDGNGNYYRKR